MGWAGGKGRLKIGLPHFQALPGNGKNQVQVEITKSFLVQQLDGALHLVQ